MFLKHEKRLLSTIFDGGIIAIFIIILNSLLSSSFVYGIYSFLIFFTIAMFLYQFLTIFIMKNKTFGMYLLGVRIISIKNEYPTTRQILLRSVSICIPILFLVNLGYVFLNRDTKTIFDIISETKVVDFAEKHQVK